MSNREVIAKSISSRHVLLCPDGAEVAVDLKDSERLRADLESLGDQQLCAYIVAEELKGGDRQAPPSIRLMQRQQLVGYEPASDSGNFRWYPKGKLIFDLLKEWAYEIAVQRLGAMEIDSPLIYDWADSEIRQQAGSFHEQHYSVRIPDDPEQEFVLRFAGDFGLFKIMQQAQFSYRQLPLRVHEFSKSFRYERRGALAGLKRLRAFHMPDLHCFCRDLDQGWEEYQLLYRHYADLARGAEINYAICFRIVEEFYQQHRQKIIDLLSYSNRPAFVEVLSGMKHYWAVKHEFQAIDSVGGNVQLSTVQLDVQDSEIYNICYVDQDGSRRGCVICHSSIGSIERLMYSILEQSLLRQPAQLPLWLAPAQLRLVPVSAEYVPFCKELEFSRVRVEIDDSDESLGKKIANANKDWLPYVGVVGKREAEAGMVMVSERASGKRFLIFPLALQELIGKQMGDRPYRELAMPREISKRPQFA